MLLTATLLSVLLLMAMAEGCFIKVAQANPYRYIIKQISPPSDTTPILIIISSPRSNTSYNVNDITLTFNVSDYGTSISFIYEIYFKASWLQDNVTIFKQNPHSPEFPDFRSYDETFWNLTDGDYSVVITARGGGYIVDNTKVDYFDGTEYYFEMTTVSTVNFTIATPPVVTILSLKNETYDSSDVPLNFTVSETVSQISYVLDGQQNVTVTGNSTISGLTNGLHNVTVYAKDTFGNEGASETMTCTVKLEPFPTALVATTSGASAAVVCLGLLVYFKKHKHQK